MAPALVLITSILCQQPSPATLTPDALVEAIESKHPIDWKGVQSPPCAEACVAETISYTKPRPQRIIKIAGHPSTVYIRYVQAKDSTWKLSGTFESHTWNHPPRHEVSQDRVTGKRYLRIASQGARGSGVDEEVETWFDLAADDFAPLLTIPTTAHHDPASAGIGRRLHTYASIHNGTVEATFEMHFKLDDTEVAIREYTATYRQPSPGAKFELSTVKPEVQLTALLDFDAAPSEDTLLKIILPELQAIAKGNNPAARATVNLYLRRSPSQLPAIESLRRQLKPTR
ncbi:hypothetical protein F183_A42790 [Bryobacterales bacterium F-183]|nr:hypothetical protein F183_A42790 [Bryobacterales bacterium F-183]